MKFTVLVLCPPRFRPVAVTIASFLIHACNGAVDVAGNLVPYIVSYLILRKNQLISTGSSVWIPTLVIGCRSLFGGLAGWLYVKYGCYPLVPLGSALTVLACISSYWTIQTSVHMIYISMATFGIGIAATLVPTLAIPLKWCPQRKGLIAGITLSSTGVGSALFAYIETLYVNPSNQDANTVVNGLHLFDHANLLDRVPWLFIVLAIVFAVVHAVSLPFLHDPWNLTEYECIDQHEVPFGTVFRSPTYILLLCIYFLVHVSFSFVMTYYKVFGEEFINDDYFMAIVGVLAGFFNIAGRIFWGGVTDRVSFQFAAVSGQGGFTCLMFLFYFCRYGGKAMFAVWMSAMYFCYASESSTFPAGVAKAFGMSSFGTAWGLMSTVSGLASFLQAVIADQTIELIGFFGVMTVSGTFSFVAVLMLLCIHRTHHGQVLR